MPDLESTIKRTLVHQSVETSIFLIGSARSPKRLMFHKAFSDTDLLIVPKAESLDDYTHHLTEIMRLGAALDPDNSDAFDIFFISKAIAPVFFKYLKAFGISTLSGRETVCGPELNYATDMSRSEMVMRHLFYQAEALRLSSELRSKLPVANATEARHMVKEINRCFKTILCSVASLGVLEALEEELMTAPNIFAVRDIAFRMNINLPVNEEMKVVLDGRVDDWSAWMIVQEEVANWLVEIELQIPLVQSNERRLYERILEIRYMLFASLRNIFLERNGTKRSELISEYADRTASLLVTLGLSGVSALLDFSADTTPAVVKQANKILVEHLQTSNPSTECLAAATVLLEFGFKSALSANISHT